MYTLITAANSAKAHRLKTELLGIPVLLGDYEEIPDLLITSKILIKLPHPSSDTYAHTMLSLCLDQNIIGIYPIRKEEVTQLMQARQLFIEFNINIIFFDEL